MRLVEILYRLAVSFWVGGGALFTFVLTPLIFRSESRDSAARIVGTLFPGYFRWGLACGTVAILCRLFARNLRLDLAGSLLAGLVAVTAFQTFYVEPRAAQLKREIGSFEQTTPDHPLRRQFSKLHGISAVCNLVVLGGGVVLVVLF